MDTIRVSADFSAVIGTIKPMHSVNNGPASIRGNGNDSYFRDAAIPFARNHDANFAPAYGAPHTVDILAIFPDFDADENDPASYDFHLTDEYNERIMNAGTKVFYRLGNKIEHESKRYGAIPPKDPHKWARICEHIIRHMNEGWADGHHYGIEYWEIWNEPDLHPQCWDGPEEQFFELFEIAARHLKACFPNLRIGGPAITGVGNKKFVIPFFDYITRDKDNPVPLDFSPSTATPEPRSTSAGTPTKPDASSTNTATPKPKPFSTNGTTSKHGSPPMLCSIPTASFRRSRVRRLSQAQCSRASIRRSTT